MTDERWVAVESRLTALEQAVAELRAAARPAPWEPYVPADPNDPLMGHPLFSRPWPRDVAAAWEARQLKELGIDHIEPMEPSALRQMMIDEDGIDPTANEFSRGIIEMREE